MNAGKTTTLLQSAYNYEECGMKSLIFKPNFLPGDKVTSRIGLEAKCISVNQYFDFFDFVSHILDANFTATKSNLYTNLYEKSNDHHNIDTESINSMEMNISIDVNNKSINSQSLLNAEKKANYAKILREYNSKCSIDFTKIDCILVDEVQFCTREQILSLCKIVDKFSIPVLTYGLRTDFLSNTFSGSHYLLAWADEIIEIKTMCMYGNFGEKSYNCRKKAIMNIRVNEKMQPVNDGEQISIGGNEKYVSLCRNHYMKMMNVY